MVETADKAAELLSGASDELKGAGKGPMEAAKGCKIIGQGSSSLADAVGKLKTVGERGKEAGEVAAKLKDDW